MESSKKSWFDKMNKEEFVIRENDLDSKKSVSKIKALCRDDEYDVVRRELEDSKYAETEVCPLPQDIFQPIDKRVKDEFRLELSVQRAIGSGAFEALAKILKK